MVIQVCDGFELTADRVRALNGHERSRLLNFFLRWQNIPPLHACLDILIPLYPNQVALLDLRVHAFLAQGRPQDALPVIQERLQIGSSLSAQVLYSTVCMAGGDINAAYQTAQELVDENTDSVSAWMLLGQVERTRGADEAALVAYRRVADLSPASRAYLLDMVDWYRVQNDWVTASGYAVRLLRLAAEQDNPLSVNQLRHLHDYFQASGESTHAAEMATELERRYQEEAAAITAQFSGAGPAPAAHRERRPVPAPTRPAVPADDAPPISLESIPVSDVERSRILQAARSIFGFESLLPGQMQAVACALRGQDVLVILPTGGGKSFCYQLPALLDDGGTTLVVSPLIALMKDQVDALSRQAQGRVTMINSSLEEDELQQRLTQIARGRYRLVYAAPERLRQPPFLHALRKAGLNRLVIDEAHCVSAWGHDFRPDYLAISRARVQLGNPHLMALTATAPPQVRRDILRHLGDMQVVAGDVTRPNLQLQVLDVRDQDEKLPYLLSFCQAQAGSGIVYADTRARCEWLAALLQQHGVDAGFYHAGIGNRDAVQDDFMHGRVRVIVATIAFGLGIDKPDIRFIVHYALPSSLEAYYQEAGRAGRDGQPAHCLLMYTPSDRGILTRRAHRDVLTVEFLRTVYGAVRGRLGEASIGRVAAEDLERDLQSDDTQIRVAISMLERAGLLKRGPDLPRAAVVCLKHDPTSADESFAAFCRTARLRAGQPLTLDLAAMSREGGLSADDIEASILSWADAGWLDYRPAGRDMALTCCPPPADAAQRIEALLEQHETIQVQRIDEIMAYARTDRCRHGYINSYLGGRAIAHCGACDNCLLLALPPVSELPDEREQTLSILNCLSAARGGWGRQTLVRILCGESETRTGGFPLSSSARTSAQFGALAYRSAGAVQKLIEHLEQAGLIGTRQLDNGGIVLQLTGAGREAIQTPSRLDSLVQRADQPEPRPPAPKRNPAEHSHPSQKESPVDKTLFESLRAWRLEQARTQQVAPYVIFHDSHLKAIAAYQPVTLKELSEIQGVGPAKLEKYGAQVLDVIHQHRDRAGRSS